MDINLIIGIIGLVLSVVGLAYAVYEKRRSKREKSLVYEVMPPVSAAEVIKGQGAYSLEVVYKCPGEEPVYIQNAMIQYVRFTNFGKIPITKDDIAKADPLRLEIKTTGGTVLNVSLVSVTRDVCQIVIGQPKQEDSITSVTLEFDFLDYMDGGLIQILSDTEEIETVLRGTIVGMPGGIRKTEVVAGPSEISGRGCAIGIAVQVLALVAVPLIYRFVTGSWDSEWWLALPVLALIMPSLVFFLISLVILEPRTEFKFPERLLPPPWYHLRREFYHLVERRYRRWESKRESKVPGRKLLGSETHK